MLLGLNRLQGEQADERRGPDTPVYIFHSLKNFVAILNVGEGAFVFPQSARGQGFFGGGGNHSSQI